MTSALAKSDVFLDGRPRPPQGRGRRRPQPTSGMNKAEAQYAAYLRGHPDVEMWTFQTCKFQIAKGCWYTPDFFVMYRDGALALVDVKAQWGNGKVGVEDDALVKLKVVGQLYGRCYEVRMTWYEKKTQAWGQRTFDAIDPAGQGGACGGVGAE